MKTGIKKYMGYRYSYLRWMCSCLVERLQKFDRFIGKSSYIVCIEKR